MTIYGELDLRFRKRPDKLVLAVVSLSLILMLTSVMATAAAVGDLLLSRQAGMTAIALDLAIFRTPSLSSRAGASPLIGVPAEMIIPGALLVIAILALFFFPTKQRLESRLGAITLGLTASMIALRDAAGVMLRSRWGESSVLLSTVVAGSALLLILSSEKKTNTLLGRLYVLQTPGQRISLWAIRLALPLGILLALAFFSTSVEARVTIAAGTLLTFLSTLATKPRETWEELRDPEMREAAAVLPLFGLPLFAAHLWLFGLEPLRAERFVYFDENRPRFAPRSGIASFLRAHGTPAAKEPVTPETPDPAIRIEWVKPKATKP